MHGRLPTCNLGQLHNCACNLNPEMLGTFFSSPGKIYKEEFSMYLPYLWKIFVLGKDYLKTLRSKRLKHDEIRTVLAFYKCIISDSVNSLEINREKNGQLL